MVPGRGWEGDYLEIEEDSKIKKKDTAEGKIGNGVKAAWVPCRNRNFPAPSGTGASATVIILILLTTSFYIRIYLKNRKLLSSVVP